jgi:RNA polymerase primary sigma factor
MNSPPSRPLGRIFKVAVAAGIESAVRLHLLRGDSLEARDATGRTPLLIAASKNRANICSMLLEAGADPLVTDVNGQNALSLANACGSFEAAAVIEAFLRETENSLNYQVKEPLTELISCGTEPDQAESIQTTEQIISETHKDIVPNSNDGFQLEPDHTIEPLDGFQKLSPLKYQNSIYINLEDDQYFKNIGKTIEDEFGDWDPIQRREPPENNLAVLRYESERQQLFNSHAPIDKGASWEDFDAFLPDQARPLPRSDDPGLLRSIRALLRRALREGSVPRLSIEDVCSEQSPGHERDENTECILEFIIGDLGGDIDERQEFRSHIPTENFQVAIAEGETLEEESLLDAALQHFEELRSGSNDPLRIYFRSAGSHPLLTADQEVSLAKEMEAAVDSALDTLTTWPQGLGHLVDALSKSRQDAVALGRIVVTTAPSPQDSDNIELTADIDAERLGTDSDEVGPLPEPEASNDSDEVPHDEDITHSDPHEVIDWVINFGTSPQPPVETSELRIQLGRLRFRRSFLISLADRAEPLDPERSIAYRQAISDLLSARSRMAGANLRLVLDLARRYLRSGAAIEDLVQDGNLGLLSAVDRFDWRRGFRFSTMATWWIKQSITRNLADTHSAIRLPVHMRDRLNTGLRAIETTQRQRERPLSITEQAAICGLSVKRFEDAVRALSEPISLEQAELECLRGTELEDDPAELVAINERNQVVEDLLSILGRKDQRVLRMRYGIDVNDELTLEQVGQRLGLTRERIRQIESRALKRLKADHRIETTAVALGLPFPKRPAPKVASQADE